MASSNTIQVASVVSTQTFAKSDAEVAQILTWFLLEWDVPEPEGMTQAQLNKWRLDQVNLRLRNYVVSVAQRNRYRTLEEAATTALVVQSKAETEL